MILTYRFRLKDSHRAALNRNACAVNFVWNFCNETQQRAVGWDRKWPTGYELGKLTSGSSKELNLLADSIEAVAQRYAESRRRHNRPWLKFRGKRSLGWVPFKKGSVRRDGRSFIYYGQRYVPMHWREFPTGTILAGSFASDARGRWYLNCAVEVPEQPVASRRPHIGIDLGVKDIAVLSTGEAIGNPRHYRNLEERYGKAQRARKHKLVCTLTAKIANSRRDHLHKASVRIALAHDLIFVGDVSSSKLAKTRMAKSVLDAGWHTFKSQLTYKAIRHGGKCVEVDEALTTQTWSSCGCLPPERPRGIAGLGIREWTCSDCGAVHDRDVNAARNILRVGLHTLAEGAALSGAVKTRGAP